MCVGVAPGAGRPLGPGIGGKVRYRVGYDLGGRVGAGVIGARHDDGETKSQGFPSSSSLQ